jgi:hypothetical protein
MALDKPGEMEEFKVMATEMNNNTGMSVLFAIYDGVDTIAAYPPASASQCSWQVTT